MSFDYAISRVRDAIEKCDGNHAKAQRMILGWLEKDQSLLLGLAAPHLQSMVSYALGHASLPQSKPMPKHVDIENQTAKPGKASQKHVDAIHMLASASKSKPKED